jgi:hypothetical protein
MELISFGDAVKMLKINSRPITSSTFDKLVKKGEITVESTIKGGWRLFDQDKIKALSKRFPTSLGRGFALILKPK